MMTIILAILLGATAHELDANMPEPETSDYSVETLTLDHPLTELEMTNVTLDEAVNEFYGIVADEQDRRDELTDYTTTRVSLIDDATDTVVIVETVNGTRNYN